MKIHSISDTDVFSAVLDLSTQVVGREIHPHRDIFRQGVDSIVCIQMGKPIQSNILPDISVKLPESLVYDSGNVRALAEELIRVRNGGNFRDPRRDVEEWKLMRELAEKHGHFETHGVDLIRGNREVVVLNGATGMLGSHILSELRRNNSTGKIYCLPRGESTTETVSCQA